MWSEMTVSNVVYSQIFMQFKMNTYLWFILTCIHLGQSQQPNLRACNVCQLFPPFSWNSLLPSSAQVHFGFLWVPYPCLCKCQLAGIICWRSHGLFVLPDDSLLKYLFIQFYAFPSQNKQGLSTMKRTHKSCFCLPKCRCLTFLPGSICLYSRRRYFYHERADKKQHMEYTCTVKEMKFLLFL